MWFHLGVCFIRDSGSDRGMFRCACLIYLHALAVFVTQREHAYNPTDHGFHNMICTLIGVHRPLILNDERAHQMLRPLSPLYTYVRNVARVAAIAGDRARILWLYTCLVLGSTDIELRITV